MSQPLVPPPSEEVDRVLRAALEEDLGPAGDVTTRSLVPEDRLARATVLAEEPLVVIAPYPTPKTWGTKIPRTPIRPPPIIDFAYSDMEKASKASYRK